jgi:hypothetical protein
MSNVNQVAAVGPSGLGASYAVAPSPKGTSTHYPGALFTLAYRAEASFDGASVMTGVTFKVQIARTADGVADPSDPRWTDLALFGAANPGAGAAVEHSINAAVGKTVALDLFADLGHRGRAFFRVLAKKSGGGAAAGADGFALYATGASVG